MQKLIDFHTHNPNPHHKCIYILDPRLDEHPLDQYKFCFGLHPWFIPEVEFKNFEAKLRQYIQHPNFFGLGECGLDRTRVNFDIQKDIFTKQLELANELNIETIIFHNVRSDADFLALLKKYQPKQRLVFHDFNSNLEMIEKLLPYDCYFSLGSSIMNNQRKIVETLKYIPKDRLFLETDDQTTISLETIYSKASELLGLSVEELATIIAGNFKQFS